MLSAERTALAAGLDAQRLDLRNQHLNRLTSFQDGLATQAAVLAGFAFSGIAQLPEGTKPGLVSMFYLAACLTLGSHIYVVCVGQLTSILGPMLALKGPKGSLDVALTQMDEERKRTFKLFVLGLLGLFTMLLAAVWIFIPDNAALSIACTVVIGVFGVLIYRRCAHAIDVFSYEEQFLPTILSTQAVEASHHDGIIGGAARAAPSSPLEGKNMVSAREYLNLVAGDPDAGVFHGGGGGAGGLAAT